MIDIAVTETRLTPVDMKTFEAGLEGMPHRTVSVPLLGPGQRELWPDLLPAQVLFLRTGIVDAELIREWKNLKLIIIHGTGVDQVDTAAAAAAGIEIRNFPGINAEAVAELTVGMLIDVLRRVTWAAIGVKSGGWERLRHHGGELFGRNLLVVGRGRIGERVIQLAEAFGMNVKAVVPRGDDGRQLMRDNLPWADAVTLHVPPAPNTIHLFGEAEFGLMRPGSVLVNTARGALIDEGALAAALKSGQIAAAALDVLEHEPPEPGNALLGLDNCIVTPHIAGSTAEALSGLARGAAQIIREWVQNRAG